MVTQRRSPYTGLIYEPTRQSAMRLPWLAGRNSKNGARSTPGLPKTYARPCTQGPRPLRSPLPWLPRSDRREKPKRRLIEVHGEATVPCAAPTEGLMFTDLVRIVGPDAIEQIFVEHPSLSEGK